MKIYVPEFVFKGDRRYVHGTTIYDHVFSGAEAVGIGRPDGALKIEFRAMLVYQAEIRYDGLGEVVVAPSDASAEFSIEVGNLLVRGWVIATGEPVGVSAPYDEAAIASLTRIHDGTANLVDVPKFSPIEISTCMTIQLHQSIHPPPPGMKWLLARVWLSRPLMLDDMPSIRLAIRRKVGDRFTETGITAEGIEIGSFGFFLTRVPGQSLVD